MNEWMDNIDKWLKHPDKQRQCDNSTVQKIFNNISYYIINSLKPMTEKCLGPSVIININTYETCALVVSGLETFRKDVMAHN